MPDPVILERWDSGAGTNDDERTTLDLVYLVGYVASATAAVALALGDAPLTTTAPNGRLLYRGPNDWENTEADDCFIVTVNYRAFEATTSANFDYSYDTVGGTAHVTQSKETINNYAPPGKTAPDFKGAIGASETGVEGADVPSGAFKWSETHDLPLSVANFSYGLLLYTLSPTTNNAPFRGFATGTVTFFGAQRAKKDEDFASLTYHFEAKPHATNLTAGDITGIEKKGWEYLWQRYEEDEDATANAIVRRPTSAHVERVLDPGDFSLLGIGTNAPP